MKVAHVFGITLLTAVISIGGTYFYTERVHNNELLTVNSSSENERHSSELTDETSDKRNLYQRLIRVVVVGKMFAFLTGLMKG